MSLSDYLLSTLGLYGPPALFVVLLAGAVGAPTPGSLLLLVAGSFVEQGEMGLWPVLALGLAGAVAGDQIGYALGRWGGGGVFLSRWLLSPLGSPVNLISGATRYPWPRFLFYDLLGEALWVAAYVLLGEFFSDSVEELGALLGDLTWAFVGLLLAALLGWGLLRTLRSPTAGGLKAGRRAVGDETG